MEETVPPNDQALVAELLQIWDDRQERGENVTAADLCHDRPDLVPMLAEQIACLQQMRWLTTAGDSEQVEPELTDQLQRPTPEALAGRYRLDEPVGQGGFGRVWRGFDLDLNRQVAVKLPKKSGEDRFLAEAHGVAQLTHPGIVAVYDVGVHGDSYFIVSEFIDGYDLAHRIRSGSIPIAESVRYVADAASHLFYAHTQGFIHRDIKSANLLVGFDGRVHVADFGLAVSSDELNLYEECTSGTLAYMSPERLFAEQGRIDDRADIYSLGVVLYELLTGQLPFSGDTPEQVREAILNQEPTPPRARNRSVSKSIERICLRCLSKSRVNRYPTAEALSADLKRNLKRRPMSLAAMAVSVLAIVLLLAFLSAQTQFWHLRAANREQPVVQNPLIFGDEIALFNGGNLDGWQVLVGQPDSISVHDGIMHLSDSPDFWLRTNESYANFQLKFDYCFPRPPHNRTGSAVLLRMNGLRKQPEAHLRVQFGGWATGRVLPPLLTLLNSQDAYDPLTAAERPIGEWNEIELNCDRQTIAVRVNGSPANQEQIVGRAEGNIGFAPLGNLVWLRKIRLRRIFR